MREAVSKVLANMREWQQFPKYSVERRIDVWLSPFLAEFIQSRTGGSVELVASEFPIRKKGQGQSALSVNADFLLYRRGGRSLDRQEDGSAGILLELKTDGRSIKESQFEQYFSEVAGSEVTQWKMRQLEDGLAAILKKTGKVHKPGYRSLLSRVRRLRDPGAAVEVCCVAPAKVAYPRVAFIGLRELADWEPKGAGDRELWALLRPLLRGLARSTKGRRTRVPRKGRKGS